MDAKIKEAIHDLANYILGEWSKVLGIPPDQLMTPEAYAEYCIKFEKIDTNENS